jgi:hypothetical protein
VQSIQLYIQGQRVDMFKDESVSITQSIKNVKDVAKIFTEFTKTFTLPASKTNNKIFKHYYNFDIVDGFDARTKKSATIELNHLPFKKGKIKLEGVELKNRRPYAYKVTFYGNTVDLKDLLGEDKLNSLSSLNSLNETFSSSEIKSALQRNPASNDVLVPLITHSKRLYFDSGDNDQDTGNLWYNSGNKHGVAWNELKYALRIHKIIEAIESRYGLTFSTDFFTSSNDPYYDLFMWLHRKKGVVSSGGQLDEYTKLIDGWSTATGDVSQMINSSTLLIEFADYVDDFDLILTRSTSTPYDISITRNGTEVYSETGITSLSKNINLFPYVEDDAEYSATLTYTTALTFTNITWDIDYTLPFDPPASESYSTGSFVAPADFEFVITEQIPEMKVIDFLTGLFKMFNLVAYVEDDGTIKVQTLDDFYSTYNTYDISQYVDVNSSQVDTALPYREVSFKYEDTKTYLASVHNQLFSQEWAKIDYTKVDTDGNVVDGSLYSVVAPFGHPKYERLINIDDSTQTSVQWGWSADDNQEAYIGKPILFYPVYNLINGTYSTISFVTVVNADGSYNNHVDVTGSINMPSNSVSFSSGTSTANINFKAEKNEYTGDSSFTGTLFENYYKTYIQDVFDIKARLTKVKAYLPMKILLNFTLADRFDINGQRYKINSIETNLATGESNIELLNEV